MARSSLKNSSRRGSSKPNRVPRTFFRICDAEDFLGGRFRPQIVVQRFLKMAACEADSANHGRGAIEKIQSKDYDVVLMDIQMPVMDGFEAITELRRLGYQLP